MSIETIVAEIRRSAEAEADRIIAEARAEAAGLLAAAEEAARGRIDQALERARPALESDHARALNAARLRLLERRAELVALETNAVFAAAETDLAAVARDGGSDRWRCALGRLAQEAVRLAGPGATVDVPASAGVDLRLLTEASGARSVTIDDPALHGIRARSADGRIEIDATIEARMARARIRLAEAVAAALGRDA